MASIRGVRALVSYGLLPTSIGPARPDAIDRDREGAHKASCQRANEPRRPPEVPCREADQESGSTAERHGNSNGEHDSPDFHTCHDASPSLSGIHPAFTQANTAYSSSPGLYRPSCTSKPVSRRIRLHVSSEKTPIVQCSVSILLSDPVRSRDRRDARS